MEQVIDQAQEQANAETSAAEALTNKLRAVFDEGVAAGKAEDAIKLELISAGATFKNVTRMYNEFMVAGGHTASKEERDQKVLAAIEGADLTGEEGFNAAVASLVAALQGATEKSASALIRAAAKKQGVECFKKAKESTGEGKTGFASKFYDYLVANPTSTKEQAVAFIQGTDGNEPTSDNVKKHQSHYLAIHNLVNRIAGVA